MTHYVCSGSCGGVSDKPLNCQMKNCSKYNKPLIKCECSDGKHEELFESESNTREANN